ncbi:MAG: SGNH/GDSL hydrolase family protein [Flavobacteriales bacterium]
MSKLRIFSEYVSNMLVLLHIGLVFILIQVLHIEESLQFSTNAIWLCVAAAFRWMIGPVLDKYLMPVLFITFCFLLFPYKAALVLIGFLLLVYGCLLLKGVLQFVLLGALLVLLFACRFEWIIFPEMAFIFPYAGSVIMFRLIYFFYYRWAKYEVKNHSDRLAYFFQFPNLFFLLYPILDYKAFSGYYQPNEKNKTYARAINYLYRGILFSLVYRAQYYLFQPDPVEADNLFMVSWYFVSMFMLMFRVIAMFYFSIGLLGLFGYNMPDVFGNFFSAASFTDSWRKINTYWRNFMIRVIYNTVYMKIKRWVKAETSRLFFSIMLTFIISGFFHFYQNYMIQGQPHMKLNDGIYWAVFGFFVFINSRNELLNGKKTSTSFLRNVFMGLFVITVMIVLYNYWNASSSREFIFLLSRMLVVDTSMLLQFFVLVVSLAALVAAGFYVERKKWHVNLQMPRVNLVFALFFSLVLAGFANRGYVKNKSLQSALAVMEEPELLNKRDRKELEKGYYQKTLDDEAMNIKRWELMAGNQKWNLHNYATVNTGDILFRKLIPDSSLRFKGKTIKINSFGLRDKEYKREKGKGVVRIALLGGSYEMGSGVGNEEDYESILEQKLTAYYKTPVEIWNFGLGGYHLMQAVRLTDVKTPLYDFDCVMYVAHSGEKERIGGDLAFLYHKGVDLTYPFVKEYSNEAGFKSNMCRLELEQRAKKVSTDLAITLYQKLNWNIKQQGAFGMVVFLPALGDPADTENENLVQNLAARNKLGFINLAHVYKGSDIKKLYLAPWDNHPNAKGHKLIAEKLFKEITEHHAFMVP